MDKNGWNLDINESTKAYEHFLQTIFSSCIKQKSN